MNERSLSHCAWPKAQPKVVLMLPRGGPFLNFGLISGANKLVPLLGTNLKILPGKNDKDLDLNVDGEQSVRHQEG